VQPGDLAVPAQGDVGVLVAPDRQVPTVLEADDPLVSVAVAVQQEGRPATRSHELLLQLGGRGRVTRELVHGAFSAPV
jgi:hypothetical protein